MVSMHDSLREAIGGEAFLSVGLVFQTLPFLTVLHLLPTFGAKHCQEAGGLSQASDFGWRSPVLHSVTMAVCGESRARCRILDGRALEPPLKIARESLNVCLSVFS